MHNMCLFFTSNQLIFIKEQGSGYFLQILNSELRIRIQEANQLWIHQNINTDLYDNFFVDG